MLSVRLAKMINWLRLFRTKFTSCLAFDKLKWLTDYDCLEQIYVMLSVRLAKMINWLRLFRIKFTLCLAFD